MKLDDLKQDWQQAVKPSPVGEKFDEMIKMLEQETNKVDKEIKRRDWLEIGIAILLLPVWIYHLPNSESTIQTVGLICAIASCCLVIYTLHKAKQVEKPKDTSVKAFLETEIDKVKNQKVMLESIVWWYIGPLSLSIVLVTLGANVSETGVPIVDRGLVIYYGFLGLLVIGTYLLNKRGAKKKFGPLLEKLERRLAELNQN